MTDMNFFACSVGEPGKDYVEDNFERIMKNKSQACWIRIGQENRTIQQRVLIWVFLVKEDEG